MRIGLRFIGRRPVAPFTLSSLSVIHEVPGWERNAMNWYVAVLKNYAGFSGRARRMEYWMFALISGIIVLILDGLGLVLKVSTYIGGVYGLLVLIPSLAV